MKNTVVLLQGKQYYIFALTTLLNKIDNTKKQMVKFIVVMSGLGLTIANKSATMLQSVFVMFACIIIFQLMSGLFTPISSMPQWAQYITYAIPPRYFIEIMRAVYLKGSSVGELWQPYVCLTIFAAGLSCIAGVTYRKQS